MPMSPSKQTTADHEDSAPADSFAPEQVAASSTPVDDRPKIMRDTDIEGLMRQYNLTRPEAEELWNRSDAGNGSDAAGDVVDTIKGARVVYRPVYEQVPATLSHPLVAIDERARLQALDGVEPEPVEPGPDATRPESGPYGPHASYPKADVSAEEIAQQTGLPVEVVSGEAAS
jgi:hypothetical protein